MSRSSSTPGAKSAAASAQIVGMPGLQARPTGGRTSIGTGVLLAFKPLRPAGWRALPDLLPVDRQVEQAVALIHRLDAAPRRPVGLEDIRAKPIVRLWDLIVPRTATFAPSNEPFTFP